MKLRSKITALLASTFLILLVVVYVVSYTVSLSGFSKIETSDITQDVGQVTDSINDNENNLGLKANDWSAWDDAWNFVQNGNQGFIDANLPYASIQDLNINFMIFINKQGGLVKYAGLDYNDPSVGSANYQGLTLPDDLRPYISIGSPILNLPNTDSSNVGIINLSEGPLIFAARPITHGDGSGPIEGTLVFARYLYWTKPNGKVDTSQVDNLSNLTQFNVSAYGVNSGKLPPDASAALSQVTGSSQVVTKVINSSTVAGYAVINDIYNKPAVLVRVEVPRTIYAQGLASLNYFIIALLGIGVIFGVLLLILLDRMILSRVSRLSDALATVTVNHDYSTRLPSEGKDRLTQLALSANLLLDELQLYPQIRQTVESMRRRFYGEDGSPDSSPTSAPPSPGPTSPTVTLDPSPVPQMPIPADPAAVVPPAPPAMPATPAPEPAPQPLTQPPAPNPLSEQAPPPVAPDPPVEQRPAISAAPEPPELPPHHDPHDMFDPANTPPHLPAHLKPPAADTVAPEPPADSGTPPAPPSL